MTEQLIEGVDVSHFQGPIDWLKVARSGKRFAYCKASEGVSIKDRAFAAHMLEARAARLRVGAYHFLAAGSSGEDQAMAFLRVYRWQPGDLPPMLDVETAGRGETPASLWLRVGAWCTEWEMANLHAPDPIIYTTSDMMRRRPGQGFELMLGGMPLWVAHWGVSAPIVPAPWKDWLIWQNSNRGRVPGIRGDVDINVARPALFDGCG